MLSSWSVYRCARRAWHGTSWHAKLQRCTAQHSTTEHYTDRTKNQHLFGSVCEMANTVIPHARLFFVSIGFVNKHWCTMWSLFCVCISNSRRKIWELFSLESSHEYSALSLSQRNTSDWWYEVCGSKLQNTLFELKMPGMESTQKIAAMK